MSGMQKDNMTEQPHHLATEPIQKAPQLDLEEARQKVIAAIAGSKHPCPLFTHTNRSGKRCQTSPYTCLHYATDPIPSVFQTLLRCKVISIEKFVELAHVYFTLRKEFRAMDVPLHRSAQESSNGKPERELITTAQNCRDRLVEFLTMLDTLLNETVQ